MKIVSASLGFAGFLLGTGLGQANATHPVQHQRNYLRRAQATGTLTMFGPDDTGSVKDYGKAEALCSSLGLALASRSDYCSDGITPFGGVMSGQDQWAPIADSDNGWIQLGDAYHNACAIHDPPPSWGADGVKATWEANYVLCKQSDEESVYEYGPTETGSVKDYAEAQTFCSSKGLSLASSSDYCIQGTPYGGVMSGQDQWAPIADSDNGWIQLGDAYHSACTIHDPPPSWGIDGVKADWEANYILCKQPARPGETVHEYGPADTGSVVDYSDANTLCSSKGLTLASESDYCAKGTPYGGVKSGEDQWAPIADSDNGWIQLGDLDLNPCIVHDPPPTWGADGVKHPFEANYVLCKSSGSGVSPVAADKWPAGTACVAGSTCEAQCENGQYEWWFSTAGYQCGQEPHYVDGTICTGDPVFSCDRCQNEATVWPSDGILKCGTEPCWSDVMCIPGVTCYNCCNGDHYSAAPVPGQYCHA